MEWIYVTLAIGAGFLISKLVPLSGIPKIALLLIYGVGASYLYFRKRKISMLAVYSVVFLLFSSMLVQSYLISKYQGTVMTPNWWEALNWIRENTENCTVIATYWDPGHFITAVARRPVVFDGASQNSLLVLERNGTRVVRSRIKDIATVLFTDNETLAVDILRNYRIDGCPMYFIASRDLVFKAQWWSYFATWKPVEKGRKYVYFVGRLVDRKPLLSGNGMEYDYALGGSLLRVIWTNSSVRAFVGNAEIGRIYLFSNEGIYLIGNESDVSLFLFGMGGDAVLVPRQLENSLFTRMFFFNGYGLEKFEFVRDFGGEVKIFRVDFGD